MVVVNRIWLTFLQAPPEPEFELRFGLFGAQQVPRCCLKVYEPVARQPGDAWDPGVSLLRSDDCFLIGVGGLGTERPGRGGEAEGLRVRDATQTCRCGLTVAAIR